MSLSHDVLNAVNAIEREVEALLSRFRHDPSIAAHGATIKEATTNLKASVIKADEAAAAQTPAPAPAPVAVNGPGFSVAAAQADAATQAEKF